MKGTARGFTLVELLVVVSVISIIAAIAIPNLTAAMDRARQRRTMAGVRAVAMAVSSYATDYAYTPRVPAGPVSQLRDYLAPTYIRVLPEEDAWLRPLRFQTDGVGYTVLSYAGDGLPQMSLHTGPTTSFNDDIVIADGIFVQWPEGMQIR